MKKNMSLAQYIKIGLISGFLSLGVQASSPEVNESTSEISNEDIEFLASLPPAPKFLRSKLEKKVDSLMNEKVTNNFILNDEKIALYVKDLSTGEELLGINNKEPMQSASMTKPFFALALYHLEKEGKLVYGPQTKKKVQEMIQFSSNKSANWIIDRIGGPTKIDSILKENYPNIFKETSIREKIPRDGKTYGNEASANDYARFLEALWNDELPRSGELKRLMNLPNPLPDRIYDGIPNIPKGTQVYDKTGTTAHLVGDMGILNARAKDGSRKPYIIVGIVEKQDTPSNEWNWYARGSNVIREVSGIVYDEMKEKHDLR